MKKAWGAALAVVAAGSALTGWGGSPVRASAATEKNSVYYHGTTREAQFTSRATCDAHARAEVKLVQAHPSQAVVIPAASAPGVTGPELRTSCYPVASGHWSYLIAYFAKNGVPLSKYDHYVNLDNRFDPGFPQDDERVYLYEHTAIHPAAYWSVATCNKYANGTASTVRSRASLRLLFGQECSSGRGVVGYSVFYSAPALGMAAVRGDTVQLVGTTVNNSFAMMDALGYDYTYLSGPIGLVSASTHQAALRARLQTVRG
ncbi:hypothetical protein [Allobranchiibius sp. GilTou73]|uniref:hypothetical protein n=1 Tax=Allobranchiibius sp. GilTou73 TaxID=2904523 RepID=UPI001F34F1C5|nr:hypothetical protein [Allobranchiibius sp. GilTou73]UIJ36018.1 hypothetical protein LVQ62_06485 [Allobranchiibius sp. GilTou73]